MATFMKLPVQTIIPISSNMADFGSRMTNEKVTHYQNILDLLNTAQVQSFHVDEIVDCDHMIGFNFTLITNVGKFTAKNVEFADECEFPKLIVAFRPGFGDVLKNSLVETIETALEVGNEPEVTYQQ